MRRNVVLILLMLFTGLSILCAVEDNTEIQVTVSILPQKYFVEKIGGDPVKVNVMVMPGEFPHTYEPKPRQMVDLSKSKVYFAIGVPFERAWLARFVSVNSSMAVIHTEAGIERLPMVEHHHEGETRHTEDEMKDPHIWLSPPLVKIQALTILGALQQVDPVNSSTYEANYKDFIAEIDLLHAGLENTFSGKEGTPFMVFHPSWGYFAKAYRLKQVPIEVEGKDPKPAQLMEIIKYAKLHGIKVIFVQPQFSTRSADLVAKEIGGKVVSIDPLAFNWAENLRKVASIFGEVFK